MLLKEQNTLELKAKSFNITIDCNVYSCTLYNIWEFLFFVDFFSTKK